MGNNQAEDNKDLGNILLNINQELRILRLFLTIGLVVILFLFILPILVWPSLEFIIEILIIIYLFVFVAIVIGAIAWSIKNHAHIDKKEERVLYYQLESQLLNKIGLKVESDNVTQDVVPDDMSDSSKIPDFFQNLNKSVDHWKKWEKNESKFIEVFFISLEVIFLPLILGPLFRSLNELGGSAYFAFISLYGIPTFTSLIVFLCYAIGYFQNLEDGQRILSIFATGYLKGNVDNPLQKFAESDEFHPDIKQLLDALHFWDNFYHHAFTSTNPLNKILKTFHLFMFPVKEVERYLQLFSTIKSKLKLLPIWRSNGGISNPELSVKELEAIAALNIIQKSKEYSIRLVKNRGKEKIEKYAIVISLFALFQSILFPVISIIVNP